MKIAVVPTGLEMDWGCCTNSAGAERRKEKKGEKSHDDPTCDHSLGFSELPLLGNTRYLASPQHRQQITVVWVLCL